MINIKGIDKAAVLAALYNRAKPKGLGVLQYIPGGMETEEARLLLSCDTYFDYVHGRALKVDLSGDAFDERLYDRDNGPGAAAAAVDKLRGGGGLYLNIEWLRRAKKDCRHRYLTTKLHTLFPLAAQKEIDQLMELVDAVIDIEYTQGKVKMTEDHTAWVHVIGQDVLIEQIPTDIMRVMPSSVTITYTEFEALCKKCAMNVSNQVTKSTSPHTGQDMDDMLMLMSAIMADGISQLLFGRHITGLHGMKNIDDVRRWASPDTDHTQPRPVPPEE